MDKGIAECSLGCALTEVFQAVFCLPLRSFINPEQTMVCAVGETSKALKKMLLAKYLKSSCLNKQSRKKVCIFVVKVVSVRRCTERNLNVT